MIGTLIQFFAPTNNEFRVKVKRGISVSQELPVFDNLPKALQITNLGHANITLTYPENTIAKEAIKRIYLY